MSLSVSVIIPAYNVENIIQETLESLMTNVCDLEVIVVDDGSMDKTSSVVEKVAFDDHRIKLYKKANGGVSSARNYGLQKANGDFILFCDSDDIMYPGSIDKLYSAAISLGADYVYGGVKKFSSEDEWFILIHEKSNLNTAGFKELAKNPELFYSMAPYAKLIKKDLLINNNFPENITCGEDQVVVLKVLANAKKIYCIGEYVYKYRERDLCINEKSITQQKQEKALLYLKNIAEVIKINKKVIDNISYSYRNRRLLLRSYIERVLRFDVWPNFYNVIKFDKCNLDQAFGVVISLLNLFDRDFIIYSPGFRYYFIRVLIGKVDELRLRDFRLFRELLFNIVDKLDDKTKKYLLNKPDWGNRFSKCLDIISENGFFSYIKIRITTKFVKIAKKFVLTEARIRNLAIPVFSILPKNPNKFVFATSTPGKVSANFEYLLNELKRQNKNTIIKKFLGLTDSKILLIQRYYHLCTASTVFLESYYRPLYGVHLPKEVKVMQVWHGCGALKRFGASSIGWEKNSKNFEINAHSSYTDVLVSSPYTGYFYEKAFLCSSDIIRNIGVPRTDLFFNKSKKNKEINKIYQKYPELSNKQIILYAPTFRGDPVDRKTFKLCIDLNILDNINKTYILAIKLHPLVEVSNIVIPNHLKDRVIILPHDEQINSWMLICKILISDYSSLIFEYSLLGKPIIYFIPDIEMYNKERGSFLEFSDYIYGGVAKNNAELLTAIKTCNDDLMKYKDKRDCFINKFMLNCDGKSSARIISYALKK